MKEKLYDLTPLEPMTEKYIGFSTRDIKKDLSEMGPQELKADLKKIQMDINGLKKEQNDATGHAPVYAIKEQIANLEVAANQILDELASREKDDDSKKTKLDKEV